MKSFKKLLVASAIMLSSSAILPSSVRLVGKNPIKIEAVLKDEYKCNFFVKRYAEYFKINKDAAFNALDDVIKTRSDTADIQGFKEKYEINVNMMMDAFAKIEHYNKSKDLYLKLDEVLKHENQREFFEKRYAEYYNITHKKAVQELNHIIFKHDEIMTAFFKEQYQENVNVMFEDFHKILSYLSPKVIR